MRNKLHDGPTHLPIGPRNYDPMLPKKWIKASLAALQWAADRAGLSYGIFSQNLTPADEARIQQAYDEYREQCAKELKQHAAKIRNKYE